MQKEKDFENLFGSKNKEIENMVQGKGRAGREKEIDDDDKKEEYIDLEDLDYYEYGDIIETIEENGWAPKSNAGLYPLTHFETNIVHTKPCKKDTYDTILELLCPSGMKIAICGYNQEDIDKEEFIKSANLFSRPHSFSIKLMDDNNNEITYTTLIGISKVTMAGDIEKLYVEFYGDLCPSIDGKLKKKEDRYYFAETIILQNKEKLLFQAYWPPIDIKKVELLMMADIFIKDKE